MNQNEKPTDLGIRYLASTQALYTLVKDINLPACVFLNFDSNYCSVKTCSVHLHLFFVIFCIFAWFYLFSE